VPSVPRIAPAEPQRTVPPELTGLIADPSQLRTEREQRTQERLAERQRKMEELQKMSAARALPRRETTAPATEAASPSPSPTPEQAWALVRRSCRERLVNSRSVWQARARTQAGQWTR